MHRRSYKSGAQKRKEKLSNAEIISKLPKLDQFFSFEGKGQPGNSDGQSTVQNETKPCDNQRDVNNDVEISDVGEQIIEISKTDNAPGVLQNAEPEDTNVVLAESNLQVQQASNILACEQLTDPAIWGTLSQEAVCFLIQKGPSFCQNWKGPFEKSCRVYTCKKKNKEYTRRCCPSTFTAKKANGEIYNREWLLYSTSTGKVYCFVCKLFPSCQSCLATDGFNDWKNLSLIDKHEESMEHRNAMLSFLIRRRQEGISGKLEAQIEGVQHYWRNVLRRIVAVITTLSERGLAFRGTTEKFGTPHNGNFLGLLELLARFDPFLAEHIARYGNSGRGQCSYLSKTVCDEIICLLAEKVKMTILEEVKTAGYYSVSVDSTPDCSHTDQLTVILRYVCPNDCVPTERYIAFLPIENHTGENLARVLVAYLQDDCKLDFAKCRGQSYDNAANMSGQYNGMQQKIKEINPYAVYIPCAAHSLNLVGRSAVDCCLDAVNFFSIVQRIYTFFSASTHRWQVLLSFLETGSAVPKHLSDTRWEAHARATNAVLNGYAAILEALESLHLDESQTGETRLEAGSILGHMQELEFLILLYLWNDILHNFEVVSKALQNPSIPLTTCAALYETLVVFLQNLRNQFDEHEQKAKLLYPEAEYRVTKIRKRVRKRQVDDGSAPDVCESLNSSDKFRFSTFLPIVDALICNISRRSEIYKNIAKQFAFLTQPSMAKEDCKRQIQKLIETYPLDIDQNLIAEFELFKSYLSARDSSAETPSNNEAFVHEPQSMYSVIFGDSIRCVYPNVEVVLRLYLTLMVTNCSGERSFSALKRIKSDTRSTMSQDRLNDLTMLFSNSDILRKLNFDEFVDNFVAAKDRKKII